MEASPATLIDGAPPGVRHLGAPRARLFAVQTDAALCRAAGRGDDRAFAELHRRYTKPVNAFVFHLIGRSKPADVEDVVQDAFVRAFAGIRDKGFEGSFRPWLYTIAHNRAMDVMRAHRDSVPLDAEQAEPIAAPPAAGTADQVERRDDLDWLVAAVADLPERQRSALLLRELAGLSHDEIAERLDTSSGSARQLLSRARDNLSDAAERDDRSLARSRRGLDRQLIASTPLISLAAGSGLTAAGAGTAGAGAGAAGLFFGKAVATIAAIAIAAGAVETVREASTADPVKAGSGGANHAAPSTTDRSTDSSPAVRDRSSSDLTGRRAARDHAGPAAGGGAGSTTSGEAAPGHTGSQDDAVAPTELPRALDDPARSLGDVPGNLVDDVDKTLSGEQTVPQTVDNVVGDVGGAVGGTVDSVTNTVDSLLKPKSK